MSNYSHKNKFVVPLMPENLDAIFFTLVLSTTITGITFLIRLIGPSLPGITPAKEIEISYLTRPVPNNALSEVILRNFLFSQGFPQILIMNLISTPLISCTLLLTALEPLCNDYAQQKIRQIPISISGNVVLYPHT